MQVSADNLTIIVMEAPKINFKLIHERENSTQLHFLGFKLTTNMTVRPVMDILKSIINVDVTQIKKKSKIQPTEKSIYKNQNLDKKIKNTHKLDVTDDRPNKYLKEKTFANTKSNRFDMAASYTSRTDANWKNTTPTMNLTKPVQKKEDTEYVTPSINMTPKNISEYSSKASIEDIPIPKSKSKMFKKAKYNQMMPKQTPASSHKNLSIPVSGSYKKSFPKISGSKPTHEQTDIYSQRYSNSMKKEFSEGQSHLTQNIEMKYANSV